MSSLIRAANLRGIEELIHELNGDPDSFMQRFHLPSLDHRNDDTFVAYENAARLVETAALELHCQDFGLRLSNRQGLEMLGPVAIIARNSKTVADAFDAIGRFLHIHCPALRLQLCPASSDQWIELDYKIIELSTPQLKQSYELSIANGMRILSLLGGEDATANSISFMHAQVGPIESYRAFFHCDVLFDQPRCRVRIDRELLQRRIDQADELTRHYATSYLESWQSIQRENFSQKVTELIQHLLPTGHCTIKAASAELHMQTRTLQRKLSREHTSFSELVDEERKKLATHYLAEPRMTLTQVTGLLGFTEQSTFTTACRRWFGTTPRKYRQMLIERP